MIDGALNDPAWEDAVEISDWHTVIPESGEPYTGPRVRVAHDDKWLYAAYDVPHPNAETIRPYCTKHDERVQGENSCR